MRRCILLLGLLSLAPTVALAQSAGLPVSDAGHGVVFVLDGSGCLREMGADLSLAVADAGLPLCVRTFDWTHGHGRVLADLRHQAHHRISGRDLAALILAERDAHPSGRIVVVAHSSGAAVILAAVEQLPKCAIDRIILLAPAVSCHRDLGSALCVSREGIDSFYSHKDWTSRILCLTGTTDGWGSPAAGLLGFKTCLGEDSARLRQYPWEPHMGGTGHSGGHYGCTRLGFFRAYIVPLLACHEERR